MIRDEAIGLLKGGPASRQEWNRQSRVIGTTVNLRKADLRGADLEGFDLRSADLREVRLLGARLAGAKLDGADLTRADLSDAVLDSASLHGVDFRNANLSRASLKGAYLPGVDFSGATIWGCDLSGAVCFGTLFTNLDLSQTKGLDSVRHQGPSSVGTDTLVRSKGKIPEPFLRGCGLAEAWIANLPALIGAMKPIQFSSVFVSYSQRDEEFAQRLYSGLQSAGIRCWYAPEDLKIGDEIRDRIDESIRLHDKLLVVLSEHSVASQWVNDEVETALEQETRRGRTVLFPIRLDDAVMDSSSGWVGLIRRRRHIGDFRNWKDHDAFQASFARLLRDLKAEDSAAK